MKLQVAVGVCCLLAGCSAGGGGGQPERLRADVMELFTRHGFPRAAPECKARGEGGGWCLIPMPVDARDNIANAMGLQPLDAAAAGACAGEGFGGPAVGTSRVEVREGVNLRDVRLYFDPGRRLACLEFR
ncbi:MAG: hypothetical protein K2X35_12810 [Bryobacteraceae bacterium]|nr:hypothetical protein [Bryobacteraceae bacterium]